MEGSQWLSSSAANLAASSLLACATRARRSTEIDSCANSLKSSDPQLNPNYFPASKQKPRLNSEDFFGPLFDDLADLEGQLFLPNTAGGNNPSAVSAFSAAENSQKKTPNSETERLISLSEHKELSSKHTLLPTSATPTPKPLEKFSKRKRENSNSSETEKEEKERKCFREKQRRAELNTAFTSLAKTLNISEKTEKTALVKTANLELAKLKRQVSQLQSQLAFVALMPKLSPHAKAPKPTASETSTKPTPPEKHTHNEFIPIVSRTEKTELTTETAPVVVVKPKQVGEQHLPSFPLFDILSSQTSANKKEVESGKWRDEKAPVSTLEEMKSLVERVESIYQRHKAETMNSSPQETDHQEGKAEKAGTFPHCA